mgnify:CR=1 FL=1
MEDYILLGKIGKPVGLKGYFKITVNNKNRYDIRQFNRLFIKAGQGFEEKKILDRRPDKPEIVKIPGIETREQAETLKHQLVYFLREDILPHGTEAYFLDDLLGFEIKSEGEIFGKVIHVDNYGSSDVVFVDNDKKEIVLPLIDGVLKEIDMDKKVLYFDNIDDYI